MNGFQATRTLTKDPDTKAIPVLIVTTKSMETDRMWGLRQGAKDVLVKPVSEKDLVEHVNKHLVKNG
jgi:twitching motility two-component system response regulator PilH